MKSKYRDPLNGLFKALKKDEENNRTQCINFDTCRRYVYDIYSNGAKKCFRCKGKVIGNNKKDEKKRS